MLFLLSRVYVLTLILAFTVFIGVLTVVVQLMHEHEKSDLHSRFPIYMEVASEQ